MTLIDYLTTLLLLSGSLFFLAGTLGLLRFPDLYTRLHALTKADNVGLGLIVLALCLQTGSWIAAAKMVLAWILVLVSAAGVSYLLANHAFRQGTDVWKR